MNNFYQNLLQSNDYEPSKGGIKETEASVLQGMIAKLASQMDHLKVSTGTSTSRSNNTGGNNNRNQRKCYHCNSKYHVQFDFPTIAAWHKEEKPTDNEPKEKTVDSVLYKYCSKCHSGKGFWTTGKPMHANLEA